MAGNGKPKKKAPRKAATPTNGKPKPEEAKALVKGGLLGLSVAGNARAVSRPIDWGAALVVAFIRAISGSQAVAAKSAGVSVGTVYNWEVSEWWHEAEAEAHRIWLRRMKAETRRSLLRQVKRGQSSSTRFTAERLLPEFAPPTPAEINLTNTIETHETRVTIVMPDNARSRNGDGGVS